MTYKRIFGIISKLRIPFKISIFLFNVWIFLCNAVDGWGISYDFNKVPLNQYNHYLEYSTKMDKPHSRWDNFTTVYYIIFFVLMLYFIIGKKRTLFKSLIFTFPNLLIFGIFYIGFTHNNYQLTIFLNDLINRLFIFVFHSDIPSG